MKKINYVSFIAFTLAEVLITLGIIGIVAEMTIPTLMNNVGDMELKAAWKKEFSTFSQVTTSLISDNGGDLINLCTSDIQGNCLRDAYGKYLKSTKSCDGNMYSVYGDCWHLLDGSASKWLNNTGVTAPGFIWRNEAGLMLADGSMVIFNWFQSDCQSGYGCGYMYFDVNGFKKPNVVGRDIFQVELHKDRLLPEGAQGTFASGQGCDASSSGQACSAKYIYNN